MNPLLARLQPYPFRAPARADPRHHTESRAGADQSRHRRTEAPDAGAGDPGDHRQPLGIGQLSRHRRRAGAQEAIAQWIERRYGVTVDAGSQVLPVNGSREALFALAQTVSIRPGATRPWFCPNPFYQIYEGAALLAGARVEFVNSDPARQFAADWDARA